METFDEKEQPPFLEKASLLPIVIEALVCFCATSGRVLRLERFPEGEKTF